MTGSGGWHIGVKMLERGSNTIAIINHLALVDAK